MLVINYETFMKHAEKVCKSPHLSEDLERHKPLKGVKHFEDGSAAVTDSHRLYFVKDIHDRTDGAIVTPSGKKVSGNYPDIKRLISMDYQKQELSVSVADLLEAADSINAVGSLVEGKTPLIQLKENIARYDSPLVKYHRELSVQFEVNVFLNAQYLLDAMKMFKASGCDEVTVRLFGPMRPVYFLYENILALILPVRKH